MDREIAVKFDSVSFSYWDACVLENASFHIHRGEFTAMVGPNGSGKTTVLKLLLGLEKPTSGIIELNGAASYVSQHMPADNHFPITVRDIVRMGLLHPYKNYNQLFFGGKAASAAVDEALEKTGIAGLGSKPFRSLSGGQKRRSLVARALAAKPALLILDEPTANMDSESEAKLYETLGAYKGSTTILIVTHDTEFVSSLTDRVLCLGNGRKIVQHGIEQNVSARHGDDNLQARVVHERNITDDKCCD
ncbi:MAG: metal ABC transporter ATP-binding protein [Treponema sp.]|nr:metal ABC transporter ATP-binding protein [Treponema sp.]